MAIDIQGLFADIIESPRQRQQAMSAQGAQDAQIINQNTSAAGSLFAPLTAQLAMSAPRREEMFRQSVGN